MAKAKTVFLNQQEMDLIHAQSVRSLQEIGIKVHSKPVLEILEKNGASMDYNAMVAKIPEKMVNQALESVQKEFTLCARDPKRDLKVPTKTYPWVTMQNTTKHVQGVTVQSAEDAKVQIELPSLVADAGWGDEIEARISGVLTPVTQLTGIMGGSDLVTGFGSVDSAKGISFEQLIVDSYMWDCCKNYMHEVEISEEKIGLDAVKEVGHGHDFLTHPHTLKYLRGELSYWEREKLELLEMDKQELPAEANKIVKSILDKHQVEPIANDLIEKGDAIIKKYEDMVGD